MNRRLRLATAVSLCGLALSATAVATVLAAVPPAKKTTTTPAKTVAAPKTTTQPSFTDNTPLTEQQKIVHLLSRAAFGPRPGDVERVQKMGIAAYIEEQLHPERISDAMIVAKLAPLTTLQMPSDELTRGYVDGLKRAKELKRLQGEVERKNQPKEGTTADSMAMQSGETPSMAMEATPGDPAQNKRRKLQATLANMTPEERARARELMQGAQGKSAFAGTAQLAVAKTVRAIESPRQLQEVMVDFWSNHFNIDVQKNYCRVYKVADDRDVIQKYTFSRFRDLLGASAKSPAMLVYAAYATIVYRTVRGALTLGDLTLLSGTFARSRDLIQRVLLTTADLYEQALYLDDLYVFFAMQPTIARPANPRPVPNPIREGFEFREVWFRYP
ncbi:MAG: DUF1800 family protein, partial [Cytophagales bacterium]|nr:DUF1800 family protein [Armatimonadota bacterium]